MAEELWMHHGDGSTGVDLEAYWDPNTQKLTRATYTNPTNEAALLTIYMPDSTVLKFPLDGNAVNKTWAPNPNQAPVLTGVDVSFRYPASAFPALSPGKDK